VKIWVFLPSGGRSGKTLTSLLHPSKTLLKISTLVNILCITSNVNELNIGNTIICLQTLTIFNACLFEMMKIKIILARK